MDPVSALSIAAAVVQFIQFCSSLTSKAAQIYKSAEGALAEHIECDKATARLIELSRKVKDSLRKVKGLGCLQEDATAIEAICNGCVEVSEELQSVLSKLRIHEDVKSGIRRKWKSLREAIRGVWSLDHISQLKQRLLNFREELEIHLMISIREKVDAVTLGQSSAFAALNEDIQLTIRSLSELRCLFKGELADLNETLVQTNIEEHFKTRAAILSAMYEKEASLAESSLLRSLGFPTMRDRHEGIAEAHRRTFQWIFEKPKLHNRPWGDFTDWLHHGNGIYWINGKAGSGKSTLMRYIVDECISDKSTEDGITRDHLKIWSKNATFDTAAFFFWNSGLIEQRSQEGLLRSLLYEILHKQPKLVRLVLPHEWADDCSASAQSKVPNREWSLAALKQAFTRLTTYSITSVKLCFFIDGLDEYGGDHDSMAEYLKTISTSPHVKFCVSSRPWLAFEDIFQNLPGLRLQDLTFSDIKVYVGDVIEEHHRMRKLSQKDPKGAAELTNEIVSKANGVFLWVKLVVKSLLNGLRNRDDLSDLQRRLHQLPSELGALYSHMLDHVEPLYREQASRAFQIFGAMSSVQGSIKMVSALELEMAISATQRLALTTKFEKLHDEKIHSKCEDIDAYLKSRCAGMLEIYEHSTLEEGCSAGQALGSHSLSNQKARVRYHLKVAYLHRTVRDFLEIEDVRSTMLQHTANMPSFDPNSSILMSYILRLKQSLCYVEKVLGNYGSNYEHSRIDDEDVWLSMDLALLYAAVVRDLGEPNNVALVDELDRVGTYWAANQSRLISCKHWSDYNKLLEERGGFFAKAISANLLPYVDVKLRMDNTVLLADRWSQPLLTWALIPVPFTRPDMVKLLLRHGADPNQLWAGSTPWQTFITSIHGFDWEEYCKSIQDDSGQAIRPWIETFKLLLRHGASLDATCAHTHPLRRGGSCHSIQSHELADLVSDVFETRFPHETEELRQIIEIMSEQRKVIEDRSENRNGSQNNRAGKRVFHSELGPRRRRKR